MEKIGKGLLYGLLVLAVAIPLCSLVIICLGSGIVFAVLSVGIPHPVKLLGALLDADKECLLYGE
jgi:hypothetical protein